MYFDWFSVVIIKLLAFLFSRLPSRINLLKKLEIGVALFCWKQSRQALQENKSLLASTLLSQAKSEYQHADAFCHLEGGTLTLKFEDLLDREFTKKSDTWTQIDWDTKESKKYLTNGISCRYLIAKCFFKFQCADAFFWSDKLAFMSVLESFQFKFYQELTPLLPAKEQRVVEWVLGEEVDHAATLTSNLCEVVGDLRVATQIYQSWYRRAELILVFLPILLPLELLNLAIIAICKPLEATAFLKPKERGKRMNLFEDFNPNC